MGRWKGDTNNQHNNKQQQRCAAATCTPSPKPPSESPLLPSQSCQAEVEGEKGTGRMGRWNGDTNNQHNNKQQQRCAAATCTHLQNPHQNHPFSQLRAARLKLSKRKELNNGTLEWGHKKPTHQQAATQVRSSNTFTSPKHQSK